MLILCVFSGKNGVADIERNVFDWIKSELLVEIMIVPTTLKLAILVTKIFDLLIVILNQT